MAGKTMLFRLPILYSQVVDQKVGVLFTAFRSCHKSWGEKPNKDIVGFIYRQRNKHVLLLCYLLVNKMLSGGFKHQHLLQQGFFIQDDEQRDRQLVQRTSRYSLYILFPESPGLCGFAKNILVYLVVWQTKPRDAALFGEICMMNILSSAHAHIDSLKMERDLLLYSINSNMYIPCFQQSIFHFPVCKCIILDYKKIIHIGYRNLTGHRRKQNL